MLLRLLLLLITVPLVELVLLLYLAELTDWRLTLGLVVATGIVGSLLAKSQGLRTFRRIQRELAAGHLPGEALLDAVMIFVAGALLLTPGMLTDLFGITLLIPACRRYYREQVTRRFASSFPIGPLPHDGWQMPAGGSQVIDSYVVKNPPDEDR